MELYGMTDDGVANLIAQRVKQRRLESDLSQAEMAGEAGISLATYEKFENGKNPSLKLKTLIAILRTLDLLDNVDSLVPEKKISPRLRAKLQGKKRKRASVKYSKKPFFVVEENSEW